MNPIVPGAGFREGSMGDFFGSPAAAAKRPPENLFERRRREFIFRQRSEDEQGRKKIRDLTKSQPRQFRQPPQSGKSRIDSCKRSFALVTM
jgi:hypothetical protein